MVILIEEERKTVTVRSGFAYRVTDLIFQNRNHPRAASRDGSRSGATSFHLQRLLQNLRQVFQNSGFSHHQRRARSR